MQKTFAHSPAAANVYAPPRQASAAWEVVETSDQRLIDEICRFRVEVWREEGQLSADAFPTGRWRDAIDDHATHWLIRTSDGSSAAAGRLSIHPSLHEVHQCEEYLRFDLGLSGPIAAPDRVVVAPFARANGLGKWILDLQDAASIARGATHAVRQASPRMVQLLKPRGWRVLGPASPDPRFPGVEFQVVIKTFDSEMGDPDA